LVATVPETAFEGPIVVWAKNKAGYSEPAVINAPELWWCERESAEAGSVVSLFGRNLSQRPDFCRTLVYLAQAGKPGTWLKAIDGGKYRVKVLVPHGLEPGQYQLWVHAGNGGKYGWGGPLPLEVRSGSQSKPVRMVRFDGGNLQEAVDRLAAEGGGTVELPAGSFNLASTPLVIPTKVRVAGAGIDRTVLVSPSDPAAPRARVYEEFPVVWLSGDGASIASLTVRGNPRTSIGILVHSRQQLPRIRDCRVTSVKACGGGWRGIHLSNAEGADVRNNEFWGWTPIQLSGLERCQLVGNRLVSQTLNGGNSEAYIISCGCRVRKCIIEDNVCACPQDAEAGGPTGQRFIHFETGRGSVDLNWIAGNRGDKARFGDVSWATTGNGDMQNTGEVILFEANERIAYYGPLAAAGRQSATLPAVLPRTPDNRLGPVRREQLAHDAAGNETPFWPPDVDSDSLSPVAEPPVGEYFATILRGRGMGQTRRVVGRKGETYLLDRPWRVAPQAGSLVLVHTAFWRNHLIRNRTVDGMTGVQLWVTCIENILSGNQVERMRKEGIYLYACCTTLASSAPNGMNGEIGPLYFNHAEGNRCDETTCGAVVVSEENPRLPVEFPRCLGNVLRHNSFIRNRTAGLLVTGELGASGRQPAAVVQGTIAEFNVVRDAPVCYHLARSVNATLLRRNHAYSWYPVPPQPWQPRVRVAFQMDDDKAAAVTELNTTEGLDGTWNETELIPELRGGKRPAVRQ